MWFFCGGAHGVMDMVGNGHGVMDIVGNGHGDASSNPGLAIAFHIAQIPLGKV